jgi:hypothetical protein
MADQPTSRALVDALSGRSIVLVNLGRISEGTAEAEQAVTLAREVSYPAGRRWR